MQISVVLRASFDPNLKDGKIILQEKKFKCPYSAMSEKMAVPVTITYEDKRCNTMYQANVSIVQKLLWDTINKGILHLKLNYPNQIILQKVKSDWNVRFDMN